MLNVYNMKLLVLRMQNVCNKQAWPSMANQIYTGVCICTFFFFLSDQSCLTGACAELLGFVLEFCFVQEPVQVRAKQIGCLAPKRHWPLQALLAHFL